MKTLNSLIILLSGLALPLAAHADTASERGSQRALFAYLKVVPGASAEFLADAQDVIEKSRKEPGNMVYTLHQSVTDPTQFVFYEVYATHDDLQAHRNSPYVVGFLKEINPILVPGGFTLQEFSVEP